jgi:uncharacterized tellurite resistance protein B-like protein
LRVSNCFGLLLALSLSVLTAIPTVAQQTNPYSVTEIQKALNDAGYNVGKADGLWGKKSAKALKQFQQDRGIPSTGEMDAATMSKLFPFHEALRKKLESSQPSEDAVPEAEEKGETVVVTPVERLTLPAPSVDAFAGVNQSNLELVTLLRIAEYGVGSCRTESIDAAKVSRRLVDLLGAQKFTDIDNVLRDRGSDIANGFPSQGTDFASNSCEEWQRLAKRLGLDKVQRIVEAEKPQVFPEESATKIEVAPASPIAAPQKSNFQTYLVIAGLLLGLYFLFRLRRKKPETTVADPAPVHPLASASPLNARVDVVQARATLREPSPTETARPAAVSAPIPPPTTRSPSQATWVRSGQPLSIEGITIRGGFFYHGTSLKCANNAWANENCLVDPTKEVTKGRADVSGQYMPYWPSYSDIAPSSRKAYLDWLSGSRSEPNAYIGYVFLYFYGLERRVMLDPSCDDADAVIAEVRRLLQVYGSNGSFRRYANALLEAYVLKKNGFKEAESFDFDIDGGELPLNLRVALGVRYRDERPVEPALLLAFTISHPETRTRTPARRAFGLLKELFAEQVKTKYPSGYLLKSRKRLPDLSMSYRAASNTFDVSVIPGNLKVPDVMEMETPLVSLRAILDECTEKLDAYSRELGKSEGMRPTITSVAKLPRSLRLTEAAKLAPNPVDVLHRYAASGQPVDIDVLSKQIGNGGLGEPSRAKLVQLSALMAAYGFGWTADPAFALKSGKLETTAVVFRLDDLRSTVETASEVYLHTRMLLQVGMIIANADGAIDASEKAKLAAIVEGAKGISMEERRRLTADLTSLERDPGSIADWTKRLKEAPIEKRRELGIHVAHVAQADGVLGRDEVVQLEKLFKVMGIDQQELYQHLHGSSVKQPANDDLPVTIIPAGHADLGAAIPAPPVSVKKTGIDLDKLAGIRSETQNTASILGDIFKDESDVEPAADAVEEASAMSEADDGLDGRQRAFLRELLTRSEWARPDFDGLAKRIGLMPSAATEALNDWAYERFDDLLISGEDPIHVELSLIPESEFGEAA